jgi:cytochrome c
VAGSLLVLTLAAFAALFVIDSVNYQDTVQGDVPAETLTETTYLDQVAPLLAQADPANGDALLTQFDCAACHRAGAENSIAPSFTGIAARAGEQRPPLTAEAYLYESITHPQAHVVEGFVGAMPQDFALRLSDQQLGDIIAYLLTPDAH